MQLKNNEIMEICLIYNHSSLQYFQARYTDINNAQIIMKLYNIQNGSNCLSKYLRYVIYSCRFFFPRCMIFTIYFFLGYDTIRNNVLENSFLFLSAFIHTHAQTHIHKRARAQRQICFYILFTKYCFIF